MNMRTVNDAYGSYNTGLVDKMIGNAYDTVRYVAVNMDKVLYAADNMEVLHEIATNLKTSGLILGTTNLDSVPTTRPFPPGVTVANLLSSSVMVIGSDGSVYTPDSGFYTTVILNNNLLLTLLPNAPSTIRGASFRWFITYGAV